MEIQNDPLAQLDATVAQAAQKTTEQKPKSFIRVELFNQFVKDGLLMEEPKVLFRHVVVE